MSTLTKFALGYLCESRSYHILLHARTRVVRAGGNPDTQRLCPTCNRVLDFSNFSYRTAAYCYECTRVYDRTLRERRKEREAAACAS